MANLKCGNTWYIDATGDLTTVKNTRLLGVILTATAASALIKLEDQDIDSNLKLDLRVATSGDSEHFDFVLSPIVFPNGINVDTLTNGVATLIIQEVGV